MELIEYIRLFRRWLWLLVVAAFVGGGIAFIVQTNQPDRYQATTLLSIGSAIRSPNPENQDLVIGVQLTQTYSVLVRTNEILEATIEALNAPLSVGELNNALNTQIVQGTSLLRLTLTYTDPVLAADLINELARQLQLNSPSNIPPEQQAQAEFLQEQVAIITAELNSLRQELTSVDAQLSSPDLTDATRTNLTETRRRLIDQINEASNNIAGFTNTIARIQELTNSVEIVESARIPTSPVGSGLLTTTILGAMVGVALAAGVVLLFEYLNDTYRNADETTRIMQVPVLGVISKIDANDDSYESRLLSIQGSSSRSQDEYRILRTNLLFTSDQRKGVYVISSPSPQEGKSITTANLAVSMATAGLRVLLIDADLRRPRIHQIFNINNGTGITSLLSARPETSQMAEEAAATSKGIYRPESWRSTVQTVGIDNLQIITSGFIPQNPTELLGSTLMKRWVEIFRESPHIDVVLFDTPPSLAFSDAAVLAASVGAKVLLIVNANVTRRGAGLKAKERFTQVGAEVIGSVLNNADTRVDDYYGYGYYGYYYYDRQPASRS